MEIYNSQEPKLPELKKILILDNEPFSSVRKRNFFIEEFMNMNYSVYHISLADYIAVSGSVNYKNTEHAEFAITFNNKKQIRNLINRIEIDTTFVFVEVPFSKKTYFIFKYLFERNVIWGRISYYTNPAVNLYKDTKGSSKRNLTKYKDLNYLQFYLFVKLFGKRIKRISESDILFKTGESNFNLPKAKKVININYFDLEDFKLQKENKALVDNEYIVFSDVFLPYHPDLQKANSGSQFINPIDYFNELNHFFDKIEAKYGLEVVIAAHPKAKYENEFGTRRLCYANTCNLIINSKLLITHLSTSVDYALFSYKPVLFFFTPSLEGSEPLKYMMNYMKVYADKIKTTVVSSEVDNLPLLENIPIDVDAYNDVIKNYFGDIGNSTINFNTVFNEVESLLIARNNM